MKNDETLEREVIGLCMMNHKVLPDCLMMGIKRTDFSVNELGYIFGVIEHLFLEKKDYSDLSVVMGVEENYKTLARSIMNSSMNFPNYMILLNALKERTWFRSVKHGLQSLNSKITCDDTITARKSTEEAIMSFSDGCFGVDNGVKFDSMKQVLGSSLEQIGIKIENNRDGIPTGISTGMPKLDKNIYGWQPKMLYIIGARPGVGKTTLGLNFISHALSLQKKVIMFSYEMDSNSIMEKIYSMRGTISGNAINTGNMTEGQQLKLKNTIKGLSKETLGICDSAKTTLAEIKIACKLRKMRGDLDLVVIDYITKIHHKTDSSDFQRKIAEISSGLKEMAMDLEVPVIALAQLKREFDQGKAREPWLSDLKESGAIEQDADAVLLIHRPNMKDASKDQKEAYLLVAKNRFGQTGRLAMYAAMDLSKFTQVD